MREKRGGVSHTVYKQKVTYDKKGNVKKVDGIGSESCDCNQDRDHTTISETVFES